MTADADSVAWANTVITEAGPDLLRYLARRADQQDVPDLLNDTLRVLWERRADLPRAPGEARMWAFGVARNTLRNHRHSYTNRARLAAALRSVVLFDGDADRRSLDPADAAEGSEKHADVRAALGMLRESDRELVTLVHWDGSTLTQAATLIGMNPSTARTRYARAKERLASRLEQHKPLPSAKRTSTVRDLSAQPGPPESAAS